LPLEADLVIYKFASERAHFERDAHSRSGKPGRHLRKNAPKQTREAQQTYAPIRSAQGVDGRFAAKPGVLSKPAYWKARNPGSRLSCRAKPRDLLCPSTVFPGSHSSLLAGIVRHVSAISVVPCRDWINCCRRTRHWVRPPRRGSHAGLFSSVGAYFWTSTL
jgi:hypothetical protein